MSERPLTEKQALYFKAYKPRYTSSDWDRCRLNAPMHDILGLPVMSLYLEIIGKTWPGKRRKDPVNDYFDLSYAELVEKKGFKPKEIDLLIDLVNRIISTEATESQQLAPERVDAQTEETFLKSLTKFGVRADLPIEFVGLDQSSRELCLASEADDIGKILKFGTFLAGKNLLSGDLRRLLNAVAAESEHLLCQYLPLEIGAAKLLDWKAMEIALQAYPEAVRRDLLILLHKGEGAEGVSSTALKEGEGLEAIRKKFLALFPAWKNLADTGDPSGAEEDPDPTFAKIEDPGIRKLAIALMFGDGLTNEKSQLEKKNPSFVRSLLSRTGWGSGS